MNKLKLFFILTWEASKKYYLFLLLDSVISSIGIFADAYLIAMFIDSLFNDDKFEVVCVRGVSIVIFHLMMYIINNTTQKKIEVENTYVNERIKLKMSEKIMNIRFSCLENPVYLDLKERARYVIEIQDAVSVLIRNLALIIKNVSIVIELLGILSFLSFRLVLGIVLINFILIVVYISFKLYEKKFYDSISNKTRRFSYYLGLCFDELIQKDIRLYNMSDMLTKKVRSENKKILCLQYEYYKKKSIYNGFIFTFSNIQSFVIYTYMIVKTLGNSIQDKLNYGEFGFFITSAVKLTNAFRDVILEIVTISTMLNYLNSFIEFMSIENSEERFGERILDKNIQKIEFQNVSFKYPHTEEKVLKNISFTIHSSETVSIVGVNGAGKSTIVKLICRLYKPTEGTIKINGYDIWEYEFESYNKCITTIFQDYKIFAVSILENIACSEKGNEEQIEYWLEQIHMLSILKKYPNGLRTELNKAYEDEGTDLSGGEKQKLAIARALYKGGEIFILDEPTSALDPKSESEIFEEFRYMTKDKIAIYISHRMSSSTLCDKIIVLNQGELVSEGSHKELIKDKNGLYSKMFNAQANNYRVNKYKV